VVADGVFDWLPRGELQLFNNSSIMCHIAGCLNGPQTLGPMLNTCSKC
jgi:hypothetical protein